jgi:hypothetical protein
MWPQGIGHVVVAGISLRFLGTAERVADCKRRRVDSHPEGNRLTTPNISLDKRREMLIISGFAAPCWAGCVEFSKQAARIVEHGDVVIAAVGEGQKAVSPTQ